MITFGSLATIVIDLIISFILSAIAPDYLDPEYDGSSSFLDLFNAMLDFLGVTHDTPTWFRAVIVVIGAGIWVSLESSALVGGQYGRGPTIIS